ncbi:MAG: hypothetical protein KGL04_05325 [Elusimicrobia bacterium]|nr:hypothetical protein [Elusimicrobiota bacterium]
MKYNFAALWLGALNALLFALAAPHYPGSIALYGFFTCCASYMLWFGLTQNLGFGQKVLAVFLWLGIFFKLAAHLIFRYPYVEPVGGFAYTPKQYNEVLIVGIAAYAGVCAAWQLASRHINSERTDPLTLPTTTAGSKSNMGTAPLLAAFVALVVIINALNIHFGIFRVGMVAKTILPWPTNFAIYWFLGTGLSLCAPVLVLSGCLSRKKISWCLGAVIFEGILSGATTLSRGLYLWHVFPVFWAVWMNRKRLGAALPFRRLILISIIAAAGFVATGAAANLARNRDYSIALSGNAGDQSAVPAVGLKYAHPPRTPATRIAALETAAAKLTGLAADRWIGIEGIMAAVGYPKKSMGLFGQLLAEKSATGHISRYQFIADAIGYTHVDANKFQFATLPGPAGFFYLSGSLFFVFAGMMIVVLFGALLEHWVFVMTRNPFLYAVIAVWVANTIAQMGVAPRMVGKPLFMNAAAVLLIAFVQSRWWGIGWFGHEDRGR